MARDRRAGAAPMGGRLRPQSGSRHDITVADAKAKAKWITARWSVEKIGPTIIAAPHR